MLDKELAPGVSNHKPKGWCRYRLPHTNRLVAEQHTGTDR
jgi:hypothetical protein